MPVGLSRKVKIFKKVAVLTFAALMLESAGYIYGLRPSDILYHYTLYPFEKEKFLKRYNIHMLGAVPPKKYPKGKGANPELESQTNLYPVTNKFDLSRSFRVIKSIFSQYPNRVLKNKLSYLYLLDEITLEGNSVGGTYDLNKKSVYVLNSFGIDNAKMAKQHLATAVNHEISSILMKNYSFEDRQWRNVLGIDFLYKKDEDPTYQWMFTNGYADPIDKKTLLRRGLLRQYAETGVENDFNVYAEVIFGEPKRMSKLIEAYPIIARKYQVFKDFYLSIDPGFAPVFEKIDGKP